MRERDMADYQLHCFGESGNAFKAASMLQAVGADWSPIHVDFFRGAARSAGYAAVNEMAEVPTLIHGDRTLSQTGVILDYLSGLHGGAYGHETEEERREILRWLLWDNHKLTANLATWRFMANFLPEAKRSAEVIGFLKGRALAALKVLETRLDGRDYIALAHRPTIADISCAGYMYFDGEYDTPYDEFPNVDAWRARLQDLPGWAHPYDLMRRALEV